MYEVDQNESIIWGPYNADTQKAFRYECEHPGIIALEPYMNSTATSSCFSTSIDELDNNLISIYPNPTNDFINISFNQKSIEKYDLYIINNLGQKVYSYQYNNLFDQNQKKINLSNYPQGFYNISIVSASGNHYSYKVALIK